MNSAILGILIILGGTGYVHAQDMTPAHFEVTNPKEFLPKQSFWQNILQLIGVRAIGKIRPPIGTKFTVSSSAYASSPYQTDSTPCITAAGTRVRPGVVATNFLPLGTIILINGKRHIVEDKMARRFAGHYIDIWFSSTSEALQFGRQKLEITIVAYDKPGAEINPKPAKKVADASSESVLQKISSSVSALGGFLFTRTYTNPNKYDVDCTK